MLAGIVPAADLGASSMTQTTAGSLSLADSATPPRAQPAKVSLAWIGVVPFFAFAGLFLLLPTGFLVVGAFQDVNGSFTLDNVAHLFQPTILSAYRISLEVSAVSAGVASNFAGIPLAFAFLATLGRTGLVTAFLVQAFGVDIYRGGFNILSFWGLTLTYLYFQIPLMVLILTPALDGLKKEWREASSILGASRLQYWLHIALPVLWPSLLGSTLLLFANSFGAIATAYGLTGSSLNIVTILLYAQIRGDVLHDQNLGYALALGMIVITGLSNAAYIVLRTRGERWLQ